MTKRLFPDGWVIVNPAVCLQWVVFNKPIMIASQLFDLCVDVIRSISDWKLMPWVLSPLERAFQQ
jgi:hypothetical protein